MSWQKVFNLTFLFSFFWEAGDTLKTYGLPFGLFPWCLRRQEGTDCDSSHADSHNPSKTREISVSHNVTWFFFFQARLYKRTPCFSFGTQDTHTHTYSMHTCLHMGMYTWAFFARVLYNQGFISVTSYLSNISQRRYQLFPCYTQGNRHSQIQLTRVTQLVSDKNHFGLKASTLFPGSNHLSHAATGHRAWPWGYISLSSYPLSAPSLWPPQPAPHSPAQ